MDLRIVNTCNNGCLYCLENSLRNKEKFISKEIIFEKILNNLPQNHINFYGWNPLLHPDLEEIIIFCKQNNVSEISLLTNSFGLSLEKIISLKKSWLNYLGIYFNSFDEKKHFIVNWWKNSLKDLLNNLKILKKIFGKIKIIIHINNLNIWNLYKDLVILNKNFGIFEFDFVNYFPFDKPFENKDFLEYNVSDYENEIEKLFQIIKFLNLKVNFFKFSKDFFGKNLEFYDFETWVLRQIWEEDIERLSDKNPFCFEEKRCKFCFLKDNCNFYGK